MKRLGQLGPVLPERNGRGEVFRVNAFFFADGGADVPESCRAASNAATRPTRLAHASWPGIPSAVSARSTRVSKIDSSPGQRGDVALTTSWLKASTRRDTSRMRSCAACCAARPSRTKFSKALPPSACARVKAPRPASQMLRDASCGLSTDESDVGGVLADVLDFMMRLCDNDRDADAAGTQGTIG